VRLGVVDFKSNTRDDVKLSRLAKDNAQLALYAWAYQLEYGCWPEQLAIESIETGRRVSVTPSAELVESVKARLERVIKGIRAQNFAPNPTPASCMFCPVKRTCVYSVM